MQTNHEGIVLTQQDRRTSTRFSRPIDIEFWCDATRHRARLEDLGEGGFYVYTGLNWPAGQSIEFAFSLPDDSSEPIRGTGTVVWAEYMGFGVRFDSIDEASKKRIRDMLAS